MSDPAVVAATRVAERLSTPLGIQRHEMEHAAREMAKPIRELHKPKTGWISGETYCEHCGRSASWPCATARLVYPSEELT